MNRPNVTPVLSAWEPMLQWFYPEVGEGLRGPVQALANLLGPLESVPELRHGDPDGFDGLDRRGPYDRLLVSEWLLADEFPDEFIRRAAMNEQSFLRLAHRTPARPRSSVVLFDTGPFQLGPARLAQMALLLVLAARAQSAKATFGWGCLQTRPAEWAASVSPATIKNFIQQHSAKLPLDGDVPAWKNLPGTPGWDDVWIVGGDAAAQIARDQRVSHVSIHHAVRERTLTVHVCGITRTQRSVTLTLPAESVCVRTFRDPFPAEPKTASPEPLGPRDLPRSNLLITNAGRKFIARLGRGRVGAWPVPNSVNARPYGKVKQYLIAGQRSAYAVGWSNGGLSAIVRTHETTTGHPPGNTAWSWTLTTDRPEAELPLRPLFSAMDHRYFVDPDGALRVVDPARNCHIIAGEGPVIDITLRGRTVVVARCVGTVVRILVCDQKPMEFREVASFPGSEGMFGWAMDTTPGVWIFASHHPEIPFRWTVHTEKAPPEVLESEIRPLAPVGRSGTASKARLLMFDRTRRELLMGEGSDRTPLIRSAHPITEATLCHDSGLVVVLTESNHLMAYHLVARSLVMDRVVVAGQ